MRERVGGSEPRYPLANAPQTGSLERAARPEHRTGGQPEALKADRLWDVSEAAAYLQLSRHAIYRMTRRRTALRIPHIKLGSTLRFRKSDIDSWLQLLTVSNNEALMKMRHAARKALDGNHIQTQAP